VIDLERKTKILLMSTVIVLAALSGVAMMAYANGTTNSTSTTSNAIYGFGNYGNDTYASFGGHGPGHRGAHGGCWGSITISQEYKDNVINIAKNDSDVQNLLAEGYNITNIRPIINSTIAADGTVTTKATTAIVTLTLNTTGRACVTVNVEEAKVTQIVIFTKTVIDKS
jgi:hypothetical protein